MNKNKEQWLEFARYYKKIVKNRSFNHKLKTDFWDSVGRAYDYFWVAYCEELINDALKHQKIEELIENAIDNIAEQSINENDFYAHGVVVMLDFLEWGQNIYGKEEL